MGKQLVHYTYNAGACQSKCSRPHFKLGHYPSGLAVSFTRRVQYDLIRVS